MARRTHKQTPFREIPTTPVDPSSSWRLYTTAEGFARLQKQLLEYQSERIEHWAELIVSSDSKLDTAIEIFGFWVAYFADVSGYHAGQISTLSPSVKRNLLEVYYLREVARALALDCLLAEVEQNRDVTKQSIRHLLRELMRGFHPYYGAITAYESGDESRLQQVLVAYAQNEVKNLLVYADGPAANGAGYQQTLRAFERIGVTPFSYLKTDAFASAVYTRVYEDQLNANRVAAGETVADAYDTVPGRYITPMYLIDLPSRVLNDVVREINRVAGPRTVTMDNSDLERVVDERTVYPMARFDVPEIHAIIDRIENKKHQEYLRLRLSGLLDTEIAAKFGQSRSNISQLRERAIRSAQQARENLE